MIEIRHVDSTAIAAWCRDYLTPSLVPDVSNYAKGRLRCWLGDEPHLGQGVSKSGVPVDDETWTRLERWIEWRFDYCLVTFSGDPPIGILPHRDAAYSNYESVIWNVAGECLFRYWMGRQTFGRSPDLKNYTAADPPTHEVRMVSGTLVRLNAKNLHSAEPSANRWGMNFWRAKA